MLLKAANFKIWPKQLILPLALLCLDAGMSMWGQSSGAAETLILNARIYTVNPQQPWAEALAIRGDRIVAVSSRQEIAALRGPSTKVIDGLIQSVHCVLLPVVTASHIEMMYFAAFIGRPA